MEVQNSINRPESLVSELERAKADWQQAWQNFQNADKDFIDVAIWNLRAACEKYDKLLKIVKAAGYEQKRG